MNFGHDGARERGINDSNYVLIYVLNPFIWQVKMSKRETSTIRIAFRISSGMPGKDDDPSNPISRALSSLMKSSSRLPSFAQAFLVTQEPSEMFRWFGVFIRSAGDRVIFFPGVKPEIVEVHGSRGSEPVFRRPFCFDHVSLDRGRLSWHITTTGSAEHQGGVPTLDLGQGRVLWFSLGLSGPGVLREVMEETVATFEVPAKSDRWKGNEFMKAREGREFPGIYMPSKTDPDDEPSFPWISIIVGPSGFPWYEGSDWAYPYGSEFVDGKVPTVKRIKVNRNRFALDKTTDIQISALWAPGTLKIPMLMGTPMSLS
jgi:hypothetical protein